MIPTNPIQFNQTSVPARSRMNHSLLSVEGAMPIVRESRQKKIRQLAEVGRLWESFFAGETDRFIMQEACKGLPSRDYVYQELHRIAPSVWHEAMTRSDFLNLTTYVLDRLMEENYRTYPFVHKEIARIHTGVRDFRQVERWITDGGERPWQQVEELEGFNRAKVDTSKFNYQVAKYEGGDQISWEAVINDDMQMFKDLPARLAYGGGRTPEIFFTKLVADANGPHATFYTGGNGNIIDLANYGGVVNPVLNANNIMGALALLMNLRTAEGRGISPGDEVKIMVGDGFLYQTLMNIINTDFLATTIMGGSKAAANSVPADVTLQMKNWIAGRIKPVFNPELFGVVTTAAKLRTSWWMFLTNPSRPAMEIGYLQGYDSPALFRKLPNTVPLGGGGAVDELGDYEYMGTEIKGITVFGGTRMDPKATMASNGSGA